MELVRGEGMTYKIAIASSDGIYIDKTFGGAKFFHIYEISDGEVLKVEERIVEENEDLQSGISDSEHTNGCNGCDCNFSVGGGCCANDRNTRKVEMISDCRCVICTKIGFHIQKQLEKNAIAVFDVTCTVKEVLEKISSYYDKVDKRQSLRGIAK